MYHVIVNPTAGNGRSLSLAAYVEQFLHAHAKACELLFTKSPMDAKLLAIHACEENSEGILGIGGDGTFQEIVTGMLFHHVWGSVPGSANPFDGRTVSAVSSAVSAAGCAAINTPLGILPSGSGNDFALSLNMGRKKTNRGKGKGEAAVAQYLSRVLESQTRTVDIIRMNDMAYLNIANIGLDARIVGNAVKWKKTLKHHAYLASAVKSIKQHQDVPLQIDVNGETMQGEYTLIAICNGQYYGGGMRIAPHASVDDGLITVCLVRRMNKLKLLSLFPTVLIQQHVRLKDVQYMQCKNLTVTLNSRHTLCMDGNLYDGSGMLTFQIIPQALRIFL